MFLRKLWVCLWILFPVSNELLAQGSGSPFIVKRLSRHVYLAHPRKVQRVNSTSTIIVGEHFLTVVESQTDSSTAAELIHTIRRQISPLPVRYLVFTHFHLDHVSGAAAFIREYPSLSIIAHEEARKHLLEHGQEERDHWAAFIKQKSGEAWHRSELARQDSDRKYFSLAADGLNAYAADILMSPIILPNLTFRDSLNLYDQDLQVELKFAGAGHTASDIVLLIPQDRVLITGDLVHDFEPLFGDADPDSWIEVLEKIKKMDFDFFIGGHGDLHQGKEVLIEWLDYMKELRLKTQTAIGEGLSLEKFRDGLSLDSFASLKNGYAERIQKFRLSYMDYLTGPLLDAVKDEAGYLWRFYSRK